MQSNTIRAKLEPYEHAEEHLIRGLFSNGPTNIARKLYRSQLLQIQTVTKHLRKIKKTVMTVMVMNKNKAVNWFNKLKYFCFICN